MIGTQPVNQGHKPPAQTHQRVKTRARYRMTGHDFHVGMARRKAKQAPPLQTVSPDGSVRIIQRALTPFSFLRHEIGDEHVGFALDLAVAVRGKYQLASVMGEHGKAVEAFIAGDAFNVAAIDVDHVQVEVTSFRIVQVG